MTQTILGLKADASQNVVTADPLLPDWLNFVEVRNLRVGNRRVNLTVQRRDGRDEVSFEG